MSCDWCKELFTRPKNDILGKTKRKGHNGKFYCSQKCSIAAHSLPIKKCKQCGSPTKTKFCSSSCSAIFNNRKIVKSNARPRINCEHCGTVTANPRFCGQFCHRKFVEQKYIGDWLIGKETGMAPAGSVCRQVRKFIFKKYGIKCARCGWDEVNPTSGKVPVQIEHIDGDFRNCSESNLIVLCPNCHSLTPTYMRLNLGKGRDVNGARRKRQRAGIVQPSEHAPGTGEIGVKFSIPAPDFVPVIQRLGFSSD